MGTEYSWEMQIKDLWEQAAKNPPDVPHYQKLVALAHLKTAHALSIYTRWFMVATAAMAVATVVIALSGFTERKHLPTPAQVHRPSGADAPSPAKDHLSDESDSPLRRFVAIDATHGLLALDSETGEACKTFDWDIPKALGNKQWKCGDAFAAQEEIRAQKGKEGASTSH